MVELELVSKYFPAIIEPLPCPLRLEAIMLVLEPEVIEIFPPASRSEAMLVVVELMLVEVFLTENPFLWKLLSL